LTYLPDVFEPCKNLTLNNVNIYIMPWLNNLDDILPMMNDDDKYLFLYELLIILKNAKQISFEHNDIYYGNIMVKDMKPILIDLSKATFNNVNNKLENKDYTSFYKLLDYMALPQQSIYYLQMSNKKKGVDFDILLDKLKQFI